MVSGSWFGILLSEIWDPGLGSLLAVVCCWPLGGPDFLIPEPLTGPERLCFLIQDLKSEARETLRLVLPAVVSHGQDIGP